MRNKLFSYDCGLYNYSKQELMSLWTMDTGFLKNLGSRGRAAGEDKQGMDEYFFLRFGWRRKKK